MSVELLRSDADPRDLAGEPDCPLGAGIAGTAGNARFGRATGTPSLLLEVVIPNEEIGVP